MKHYWPQLLFISLSLFGLGRIVSDHGKPREPANAWTTLIAFAIQFWLLYEGGFFNGMF